MAHFDRLNAPKWSFKCSLSHTKRRFMKDASEENKLHKNEIFNKKWLWWPPCFSEWAKMFPDKIFWPETYPEKFNKNSRKTAPYRGVMVKSWYGGKQRVTTVSTRLIQIFPGIYASLFRLIIWYGLKPNYARKLEKEKWENNVFYEKIAYFKNIFSNFSPKNRKIGIFFPK